MDLGDNFMFSVRLNMASGAVYDRYSPDLLGNTNRVFISYNVACPSDLEGTYKAEITSGSGPFWGVEEMTVTVTELSAGYYEINDITMDIFGDATGPFPIAYRFSEVCGKILLDPGSVDFPTQILIDDAGGSSVNTETGVITFDLIYDAASCCGLAGGKFKFTAIPI